MGMYEGTIWVLKFWPFFFRTSIKWKKSSSFTRLSWNIITPSSHISSLVVLWLNDLSQFFNPFRYVLGEVDVIVNFLKVYWTFVSNVKFEELNVSFFDFSSFQVTELCHYKLKRLYSSMSSIRPGRSRSFILWL